MGYYLNFIERFPTIEELARADINDVMRAWQGLGYYARARNLHAAACQIVNEYGGDLPCKFEDLLKIKGLGMYSAAAVASFAFGEAVPAVDGNVYRILARVFGVFTSIDTAMGKKEFFRLASELIDRGQPAKFNQAIIDFGAMVCTFRLPKCETCIFSNVCYAFSNNIVSKLPVRGKRVVVRDRFFTYLMINHKGFTYIRRREGSDIWHLLYEFPMIETPALYNIEELMGTDMWREIVGDSEVFVSSISEPIKHQLSHITIYATFVIMDVSKIAYSLRSNFCRVKTGDLDSYPVPRLIDSYLAAEPSVKYFKNSK